MEPRESSCCWLALSTSVKTHPLIGVAVGAFGAYTLSGVLSQLLYGVSTTDPYTFVIVASLLAAVALIACVMPAYRAARVEPVNALRNE